MTVSAVSASRVQSAIAQAASRTGIDFDYLLGQARIESGLNANARAGTSSASGLYQFIEQSWLSVVKRHGAEHGLGWAANAIGGSGGRHYVADPATRQAILNLRNDPGAASLMAAEHAGDNKAALEATLGREVTGTDLYMAHFLGLGGAKSFLRTMSANPGASAAALFPGAARANRNVFFERDGSARSVSEVYSRFQSKLEAGAAGAGGALPQVDYAAQALDLDGATVITGAGESADDALAWAAGAAGRFGGKGAVNVMRPTPDTARLAYMMLANLGA
jgi:hypothetical protein